MKITICTCASRTFIYKEKVARLAASANAAGVEVELVDDLCAMCEDKDERLHDVAQTTIVACYHRAVKSLMAFVGEDDCKCLDLRSMSVEEVAASLGIDAKDADEGEWKEQIASFESKLGKDAWYPTIDKDRCAECGKCFDFCPFGVYEMVDDHVRVVHPHNCKNNCPACARTCPAGAIIFPKYDKSPINGGEESEENVVKVDSKELYNQALRERLANRRKGIKLTDD